MQTLHSASHFASSVQELPLPSLPQLHAPLMHTCADVQVWPPVVLPLVLPLPHAAPKSEVTPRPRATVKSANIFFI